MRADEAAAAASAAGRQMLLFVASALLTTAATMCAPLSKNDDGEYDYQPSTAVFLAEILKLSIASGMLAGEAISRRVSSMDEAAAAKLPPLVAEGTRAVLMHIALYFIPAFLWFVGNNLTFITLQGISPAANTVIGQAKVIITAGMLYCIMNRRFTVPQIISLLILLLSLVNMAVTDSSQLHSGDGANVTVGNATSTSHKTHYPVPGWIGVLCSLTTAFTGSLAGVYNEKLLKEMRSTIHFQNMCAYSWGIVFNLALVYIKPESRAAVTQHGFLTGYNTFTWLYVVSVATMGLSVSFVFKYLDNIARIYALGVATALTVFLSWPAFGQEPSITVICDVITIFLTLGVYYTTGHKAPAPTADAKENTALLEQGKGKGK